MSGLRVMVLGVLLSGCSMLPEIAHEPTLHNPFPQLSKVAIAPFFNLSSEPTVDGRAFALAYFNELQEVPGYEVVPVGVVERAIADNRLSLAGPEDVRRLAELLGVDAVVIGAVTDFSPYYPPRCAMQVEWYAANPCFHPIPPGYGLPWGTPEEGQIPGSLVFEAEMALAREQLATQTPHEAGGPDNAQGVQPPLGRQPAEGLQTAYNSPMPGVDGNAGPAGVITPGDDLTVYAGGVVAGMSGLPADWPDPRGFIPPPPSAEPPPCRPSRAPVLRHTRTYNGHDPDFTEALASYYYFRDDARFGGWQSYLQRSDDFIRFCCHMHIWEMLSARGGAGETRVALRWSSIR